jgi:hypothetical protein
MQQSYSHAVNYRIVHTALLLCFCLHSSILYELLWTVPYIILTFTPLTNTESLQMIHEFFLKPRAVRGKCIFSGDWHVTPHMSDDIQREFSKSIRTCTSDKSFRFDQKRVWRFQKDLIDMKAGVHYPGKQIQIHSRQAATHHILSN